MSLDIGQLPQRGRILIDSAPIIYFLENHPEFASRFATVFERADAGHLDLVISTVTLAEVLTGPLRGGNERLATDYLKALTAPPRWVVANLTPDIAYRAARIRGQTRLCLPDAVQVATALETSCVALVTHDRDFSALEGSTESLSIYA